MKTEDLLTLSDCARELDYDFRLLQYYKNTGRFIKPAIRIGTKEYYDRKKVKGWFPKLQKPGRKKNEKK